MTISESIFVYMSEISLMVSTLSMVSVVLVVSTFLFVANEIGFHFGCSDFGVFEAGVLIAVATLFCFGVVLLEICCGESFDVLWSFLSCKCD